MNFGTYKEEEDVKQKWAELSRLEKGVNIISGEVLLTGCGQTGGKLEGRLHTSTTAHTTSQQGCKICEHKIASRVSTARAQAYKNKE